MSETVGHIGLDFLTSSSWHFDRRCRKNPKLLFRLIFCRKTKRATIARRCAPQASCRSHVRRFTMLPRTLVGSPHRRLENFALSDAKNFDSIAHNQTRAP